MKVKPLPEYVFSLLDAEPSGRLLWKKTKSNRNLIGNDAGSVISGYRYVTIDGVNIKSSHINWLFKTGKWPKKTIDHIDNNKLNDAWDNLREATHQQQMRNKKVTKKGRELPKGVYKRKDKFYSRATIDGKDIYLGTFETASEAHIAWCDYTKEIYQEYHNTGGR